VELSTHITLRSRTLTRNDPPEIVVIDEPEPCPYLEGRTARLPMRLPVRALTLEETDACLAAGDRRYGRLLYRPECPACRACESLRVPVDTFVPTRSQRRALARGDRELCTVIGRPAVSADRLRLYEKHRTMRGLALPGDAEMDEEHYAIFFVDRLVDALEFRFLVRETLVGFAVSDRGARSFSAVYCAFDPDYSRLAIGTYSILKHIELARSLGLRYVYLGLYVADNPHLRYKANFLPHERLIDGAWRSFEA
jgi:arginine-tRNA-protein transferase